MEPIFNKKHRKRLRNSFALSICCLSVAHSVAAASLMERWKFPRAYGLSIMDAVTTATWQAAKNKPYAALAAGQTQYMSTHGSPLIPEHLCTIDDIRNGNGISCAITLPSFEECPKDDCIALRIDQSILLDKTLSAVIESAISAPCMALQDPHDFQSVNAKFIPSFYGLNYTVSHAWSFLDCKAENPVMARIHRRTSNELIIKF
jgi:hypothetical protein